MNFLLISVSIVSIFLNFSFLNFSAEATTLDAFLVLTKDRSIESFQAKKEYQALHEEKAITRSLYYPELGIKTGAHSSGVGRADRVEGFGFAHAYAKMNIFNGGYDKDSVRLKTIEMDKKDDQAKALAEISVKRASIYFYTLLGFQKKKTILLDQKNVNETLHQVALNKKKAGITSESDALEFENKEIEIESDLYLNEEEKTAVEKDTKAYFVLKDDEIPSSYEGDFSITPVKKTLDELLQATKNTNLKIQELSYDLIAAEQMAVRTRSGLLPKLDAEANYGILPKDQKKFEDDYEWNAQITLTWPLFAGMSSVHERKSAVYKKEAKEVELVKEKQFIKADIETSLKKLSFIQKRYGIEQKNLAQSQKYFDLTLGEYKRGVKNSPDMLTALDKLFQSKLKLNDLERDHNVTRAHLSEITGVEL